MFLSTTNFIMVQLFNLFFIYPVPAFQMWWFAAYSITVKWICLGSRLLFRQNNQSDDISSNSENISFVISNDNKWLTDSSIIIKTVFDKRESHYLQPQFLGSVSVSSLCGNFSPAQKAVLQLRITHRPCIHGENRPLMFSWCERACALGVCVWVGGGLGCIAGMLEGNWVTGLDFGR